jgi:hypothetical protein
MSAGGGTAARRRGTGTPQVDTRLVFVDETSVNTSMVRICGR